MQLIQTEKPYKNKIDLSKITNTDINWMLGNYFYKSSWGDKMYVQKLQLYVGPSQALIFILNKLSDSVDFNFTWYSILNYLDLVPFGS